MANNKRKTPAKVKHAQSGWKANDIGLSGWPEKWDETPTSWNNTQQNNMKILETFTKSQPRNKRNMLYFVRDIVKMYRLSNDVRLPEISNGEFSTHDIANIFAKSIQYFDCDEIHDYIFENVLEVFPEGDETPPSEDVVLPAEIVGLYFTTTDIPADNLREGSIANMESMFICSSLKNTGDDDVDRRNFAIYWMPRSPLRVFMEGLPIPELIAEVDATKGTITNKYDVEGWVRGRGLSEEDTHVMHFFFIRKVCVALQTINQPRFVINKTKPFSSSKKAMAKKVLGRFTPDSWNMVTWNVGEPINAKEHEEGRGGKQALHFRRGHPRKAEEHWAKAYWSTIRNRWEQYIHGYEAGHPAFGVKKNYHLPRKDVK